MIENQKSYYFSIVKFCCISILIIYLISSSGKSLHAISMEWFLLAVTLVAALGFELIDDSYFWTDTVPLQDIRNWVKMKAHQKKLFFLAVESILTIILIACFRESSLGIFLLPLVISDTVVLFHISFTWTLFSFLGILINSENIFTYLIYCLFILIIYFQNFMIIEKYRKSLTDFEQKEYQLKDSISTQDTIHKEQLEQSIQSFEISMLEEKARLSQALHDKLGHSINGSIYQLEASKVLMEKEPEESKKIVQFVIDNLRTSMDEIRSILRKEKPSKKQMAYLQLIQLCAECKDKYGIKAEVSINGENKEIPEVLWEVILDNTMEAVTNSLKYAKCTELSIEIIILHKVVRCSIHDNGFGCNLLKEGMGIQGMKNRSRKINGYIDISCDHGFHINMIFPF